MVDAARPPLRRHRGVMILMFGLLAFASCIPLGIVAWILGNRDLAAMDRGEMDPSGREITRTGRLLAIIGVVATLTIQAVLVALITVQYLSRKSG
jgi:hypothetical protein